MLNTKFRIVLQITGTALLVAFFFLIWRIGKPVSSASAVRGEEVYASHDCTDCHLGAHVLKQKREKKEVGLIRVRTDLNLLVKFLLTDKRHQSFMMISDMDRKDLIEYLRSSIMTETP